MDEFINKNEPLEMGNIEREFLRMEIYSKFLSLPKDRQTRAGFYDICLSYYDRMKQ